MSKRKHSPDVTLIDARVLVTGCAGRIGLAAVEHLLCRYQSVRGFDMFDPGLQHEHFEFVCGRVEDAEAVLSAVRGCSVVIHLAACPDDADFDTVLLPCNIKGTVAVLRAIETVNRRQPSRPVSAEERSFHPGHPEPHGDEPPITRLVVASSGKPMLATIRSTPT